MLVRPFIERVSALLSRLAAPIVRKGWKHWLRFAVLLALGSYIGHILSESDRFTDWRYWLYQKQVRWERRGPVYPRYTALVLLNDDDYWSEEYQARSKYKRDKLAALLDRLNSAGVNTVAFDIFFDSPFPDRPDYEFPDYRKEDEAFFASLGRMCTAGGHVVLATEFWEIDQPDGSTAVVESPSIYTNRLPSLPCVKRGHVVFSDDQRKIPGMFQMKNGEYLDSLSLAITRITDPIAYDSLVSEPDHGFRFGQFLTMEDYSTRQGRQFIFSGHEIETLPLTQLRQALADRTVIIGGYYHTAAYGTGDFIDTWDTPGGTEPGAMLHANFVEAMRDPNSTFTPISDRTAEIIEWSLAFLLAVIGALEVHSGWKWLGFTLTCTASIVLTYVLLQNLGLFLDFFVPILMIVAHTVMEEILEMRHQLHHLKKHALHSATSNLGDHK
jgi:CHASE2 domain-containing sensor protein